MRSDRSADFRVLAGWFATCGSDDDAHRLGRAAFAEMFSDRLHPPSQAANHKCSNFALN